MSIKDSEPTTEFSMPENPYKPFAFERGDWLYHEDAIKKIKKIFEKQPGNKTIVLQGTPWSGKTELLRRIENSPGLLGETYIPIYLDSRKYTGLDGDEFLYTIYEDVFVKLNKLGIAVPKLDHIKLAYMQGLTIEFILLTVDSHLEDNVLVLMLDEFDFLLKNIDIKIISNYIKYFHHIEKNWTNYGIILAGDKGQANRTNDETINKFLNTISNIEMREILEEEKIKHMIVEPVKDQLVYEDDAIKKITWYSGKNIYFQQLICYHIIAYLTEKNKNQCSIEDVEEVIQKILSDERPGFVFAWDKNFSTENRLAASALTDENVIEKQKNFYFLKENTLLNNIFGKAIDREIEKLHDLGYIGKVQRRQFSEYPFKIPLYGKWIQKEHPFIKTIIQNIDITADKVDLEELTKKIKDTPGTQLTLFDKDSILEIAEKWCLLKNDINKGEAAKNQIENFLDVFSIFLGLSMQKKSSPGAQYFRIDIKNLNIGILGEALCFVQNRPELMQADITNIENIATSISLDTQTKLTLFFFFKRFNMLENLVKKSYLNFIAMDEIDLKKIIFSSRPKDAFRKLLLGNISLQKVSPYQTVGPARAIFYGRSDIINQINRSTAISYAIVGSRKIGKSSLLYNLYDNPKPNTIHIFIDLESMFSDKNTDSQNYKTFLNNLQSEIFRIFKQKIDLVTPPFDKGLAELTGFIKQLSQGGEKIIFIFDEIDSLIDFDKKHNYKLMRTFRTMSQENYCQFIFAGFKELYQSKRSLESPMYNFCEEIKLISLDRKAALDLITKPMESIGVHYKKPEDRKLILDYTARHPNLLQFFCKHLVEKVEKNQKTEIRRTIFEEDIKQLYEEKYEQYILDEIYIFKTDLNNIDRLILILLGEKAPESNHFSMEEIKYLLKEKGIKLSISDLQQNLENLVIRFILEDKGNKNYCFALPIFPGILRKRISDDYTNDIIEQIKACQSPTRLHNIKSIWRWLREIKR